LPLFEQIAALPVPAKRRRNSYGWQEDWIFAPQRQCVPIAVYHQAHLLSRLGKHDEAVPVLQRFGCGFRLAPRLWHSCCGSGTSQTVVATPSLSWPDAPRLFRQAVPSELSQYLRQAFNPDAAYWKENDYSSREYFSWYYDLKSPASNLVELLISKTLVPLTGRQDLVAAEWWIHTRRPGNDLGHQLHFDMEEHTLEAIGPYGSRQYKDM